MSIFDGSINFAELLFNVLDRFLWVIIVISSLFLLLLFGLLCLLLLFFSTFLFNWILESNVNRNLIEFLEVTRYGDLDHRWVVFQIEQ
jgi:uncharacterized membrane protein